MTKIILLTLVLGGCHDNAHDLGMRPMTVNTPTAPMEQSTIEVTSADSHHGALVMSWGTFRWTAPIVVP